MHFFLASPKVYHNPRLQSVIDEEQLDEKDAVMYKTDDEVVKEEKEYNGDEPSFMVSTEDLKQETYNEEDKNEVLQCEISMQQQLTYPQNKNIYCSFQRNGTVLEGFAANTQEELAEGVEG